MRIYLDSVGCRLNWSEIETMARQSMVAGHEVVATPSNADIIVLNTCAVTAQAERKTRHQIRSFHRENPDAQIAVIGCFPTLRPERSAEFPGVEWVIPNPEKVRTVDLITATPSSPSPSSQESPEEVETLRTRAFVKVQDGCDNHCTYCIVRSLRGPSRSRPLTEITADVQMLVDETGCREAVLTGASLGAYGHDLGLKSGLRKLVEVVLNSTDISRLRLSSVEPWDIDEAFFELWDDPRLCRQIHLPLQAGCDSTLRRMGRPITSEEFVRLVRAARAAVPDLAVTTDVMVGFPGEDEVAFRESYAFVEQVGFAKLHVFPYSARPGTPATKLPHQVLREVRDERARQMRALGAKQRLGFKRRFLGRALEVLWERRRRDGRWTGWTDNYIRVVTPEKGRSLHNQITLTRLRALENGYLKGDVLA